LLRSQHYRSVLEAVAEDYDLPLGVVANIVRPRMRVFVEVVREERKFCQDSSRREFEG
jgi:hypothetical protein